MKNKKREKKFTGEELMKMISHELRLKACAADTREAQALMKAAQSDTVLAQNLAGAFMREMEVKYNFVHNKTHGIDGEGRVVPIPPEQMAAQARQEAAQKAAAEVEAQPAEETDDGVSVESIKEKDKEEEEEEPKPN